MASVSMATDKVSRLTTRTVMTAASPSRYSWLLVSISRISSRVGTPTPRVLFNRVLFLFRRIDEIDPNSGRKRGGRMWMILPPKAAVLNVIHVDHGDTISLPNNQGGVAHR